MNMPRPLRSSLSNNRLGNNVDQLKLSHPGPGAGTGTTLKIRKV